MISGQNGYISIDFNGNIGIHMGINMGNNFLGINMGNNFQVLLLVCGGLRRQILVENDLQVFLLVCDGLR